MSRLKSHQVHPLLRYYLACVEEEDRRSRQVKASALNREYIMPAFDRGQLCYGTDQIAWNLTPEERTFLSQPTPDNEPPTYLYGYPLYQDRAGYLLPLFMLEVELFMEENGAYAAAYPVTGQIYLNLGLYSATHPGAVERNTVQQWLESPDWESFEARLAAALLERGEDSDYIEDLATEERRMGWKDASLIMRASGMSYTMQLREELFALQDRLAELPHTALGPLLGLSGGERQPEGWADLLEAVPLNPSQRAAAMAGLMEPLTVVTGPPGTGKSQVIVSLIASLTAAGRSVLFASKNNEAVEVVRRRLAEVLGEDDWTLRLGNKGAIEAEMQVRLQQAARVPASLGDDGAHDAAALGQLWQDRERLDQEKQQVEQAALRVVTALDNYRHWVGALPEAWQAWWLNQPDLTWLKPGRSKRVMQHAEDVRRLGEDGFPGLRLWGSQLLNPDGQYAKYRKLLDVMLAATPATSPPWRTARDDSWEALAEDWLVLDTIYGAWGAQGELEEAWAALATVRTAQEVAADAVWVNAGIPPHAAALSRAHIRHRLHPHADHLPALLNAFWAETRNAASYKNNTPETQAQFEAVARDLLALTPAVVVTSLSARRSLPLTPGLFDCVIIDEASQCDIASALPLLFRARRAIIIGDPRQLRHISAVDKVAEERIAGALGLGQQLDRFSYRANSIYDCAAALTETPWFLAEHYRSHPQIIEFSNRVYYQRQLIIRTVVEETEQQAIFWHDVPASLHQGTGSLVNPKEARAVANLVRELAAGPYRRDGVIGVVTPYRRQKLRIEDDLAAAGLLQALGPRLIVGTVHTFQGGEADTMIFSPTLASGADRRAAAWISNEEGLLNVSLTRARHALHIVGDKTFCAAVPGPLGELAKFVEALGGDSRSSRPRTQAYQWVQRMLTELGVWFQEQWPESDPYRRYTLAFVVVGLSGRRYNIEIDERQYFYGHEAVLNDEARDQFLQRRGYAVVRLQADEVLRDPDGTWLLLSRLAT